MPHKGTLTWAKHRKKGRLSGRDRDLYQSRTTLPEQHAKAAEHYIKMWGNVREGHVYRQGSI